MEGVLPKFNDESVSQLGNEKRRMIERERRAKKLLDVLHTGRVVWSQGKIPFSFILCTQQLFHAIFIKSITTWACFFFFSLFLSVSKSARFYFFDGQSYARTLSYFIPFRVPPASERFTLLSNPLRLCRKSSAASVKYISWQVRTPFHTLATSLPFSLPLHWSPLTLVQWIISVGFQEKIL